MNISQLRNETPGLRQVIHFNNAGASLMPAAVADATLRYLEHERDHGGYETAAALHDELDSFYDAAASLIGARREEIAFTQSATAAWSFLFFSLAQSWQAGDRILTSRSEYASNYLAFLQAERRFGVRIEAIPCDAFGQVEVAALEEMLDERVKLIAISHMPTNSGLVNPAEAIGQVARKYGVPYLLDACQSAGQYPLEVEKLGCDFLSATGRKYLRGPRGTGFLYVAKKWLDQGLEPVWLDLHAAEWTGPGSYRMRPDARRFENFEVNYAGKAGLAVAMRYAQAIGLAEIWERVQWLARHLRERLSALPGVEVRDPGQIQSGIVTFTVKGQEASAVRRKLGTHGLNVSVSMPNSTLLDALERNLPPLVRASVHYYNTEEEIDRLCVLLSQ